MRRGRQASFRRASVGSCRDCHGLITIVSGGSRFPRQGCLKVLQFLGTRFMVLGGQIFEMTSDPNRVKLQDGTEAYVETMRRVLGPAAP